MCPRVQPGLLCRWCWRIASLMRSRSSSVLVVSLFLATAGSSTAHASCGDYVIVGNPPAAWQTGRGMPPTITWADPGRQPLDPVDEPAVPGCQGPSCRRHLPDPAHPAPRIELAGPDHWACSLTAGHTAGFEPRCLLGEARLFPSPGHPFLIERPPRFAGQPEPC